jgi:tetratricopeptide (TPR) repeat protein
MVARNKERDLCAEVHISKTEFKLDDQRLFEQVLSGIELSLDKLNPDSKVTPSATDQAPDAEHYFAEGSKSYLRQEYAAAADYYPKGLILSKQKHTLSKNHFRVLVDNLGMAYEISGKLDEAKATFEYGVTQDPDIHMFYYNLACAYGEMNKMDEALVQLRVANKYKANMIPGEIFPDPLKDDSFRFFINNQTFVSAIREMQK